MSAEDPLDTLLAELLSPEGIEPDPHFASQTLQLIAAQAALKAQRSKLVRDWLWQMAALGALIAGLMLFSRLPALAALPRSGLLAVASPLTLVVALWLFASGELIPVGNRRRRRSTI